MPIELAEPAPGCIATEKMLVGVVVIVLLMIFIAAIRQRLRNLLLSNETFNWLGGFLLLTSMFFADAIGPWGARLSRYATLTWNWCYPSWRLSGVFTSLPGLTLPFLGLMVFSAAFAVALARSAGRAKKNQWLVVGIGFGVYPILVLTGVLYVKATSPSEPPPVEAAWIMAAIATFVIVTLALPLFLTKDDPKRSAWIHLLPTGLPLALSGLSVLRTVQRGELLSVFRIGFWMSMAGLALIFFGNLRAAFAKPPPLPGQCRFCRYDLTGNVSGICPECGTKLATGAFE